MANAHYLGSYFVMCINQKLEECRMTKERSSSGSIVKVYRKRGAYIMLRTSFSIS